MIFGRNKVSRWTCSLQLDYHEKVRESIFFGKIVGKLDFYSLKCLPWDFALGVTDVFVVDILVEIETWPLSKQLEKNCANCFSLSMSESIIFNEGDLAKSHNDIIDLITHHLCAVNSIKLQY